MVTLLAYAKVTSPEHADEILQMEIRRQNRTFNRTTLLLQQAAWDHDLEKTPFTFAQRLLQVCLICTFPCAAHAGSTTKPSTLKAEITGSPLP